LIIEGQPYYTAQVSKAKSQSRELQNLERRKSSYLAHCDFQKIHY
jgi:hypothetical protein